MQHQELIARTQKFVKRELSQAEGGHDWFHVERLHRLAREIAQSEQVDLLVVELAALLHDIADSKFHNGNEEVGPQLADEFLTRLGVNDEAKDHVVNIVRHVSFKNEFSTVTFQSPELHVVRDADRLDALGAIGIARAFNYGGHKKRAIYDPAIKPQPDLSKEKYKQSTAPTINHFYEKLLLLKDRMHTQTGRRLAEVRHRFLEQYLAQFYREWEGKL
ncbi:MAG: HD domain-containing protein [Owenweeksia sp.]|nr:HD domain-containing protein [Owenweeksia sp.]